MRPNMRSLRDHWCRGGVLALFLMCFQPAMLPAQTAPATNLAGRISTTVQSLQASVQSLTPQKWKTSGDEKQELTAAQQSLQRNLSEAVPGLVQTWNRAPQNLSEAFRLYRDLDVVHQVASRLATAAEQHAPADQAQSINASTEQLKQSLQQLGNYIQATAALQYTQVQQARTAPPPAPAAPKSIIINDANSAPVHTTRRRTIYKKKATTPAPSSKPASPPGP